MVNNMQRFLQNASSQSNQQATNSGKVVQNVNNSSSILAGIDSQHGHEKLPNNQADSFTNLNSNLEKSFCLQANALNDPSLFSNSLMSDVSIQINIDASVFENDDPIKVQIATSLSSIS